MCVAQRLLDIAFKMAIRNAGEHMGMQHVAEEKFAAFSEEIMSLLEIVARVRDVADLDRPGTEDFFREQVSRLCELEMESDAAAEVVQEVRGIPHSLPRQRTWLAVSAR